jgi:hypothetical protein
VRALLQSGALQDVASAEELAQGLARRFAGKIRTYVQGLSFDSALADDPNGAKRDAYKHLTRKRRAEADERRLGCPPLP